MRKKKFVCCEMVTWNFGALKMHKIIYEQKMRIKFLFHNSISRKRINDLISQAKNPFPLWTIHNFEAYIFHLLQSHSTRNGIHLQVTRGLISHGSLNLWALASITRTFLRGVAPFHLCWWKKDHENGRGWRKNWKKGNLFQQNVAARIAKGFFFAVVDFPFS